LATNQIIFISASISILKLSKGNVTCDLHSHINCLTTRIKSSLVKSGGRRTNIESVKPYKGIILFISNFFASFFIHVLTIEVQSDAEERLYTDLNSGEDDNP